MSTIINKANIQIVISQSALINQSIDQSINQPASQQASQSSKQGHKWVIIQSIHPSVSKSISSSVNIFYLCQERSSILYLIMRDNSGFFRTSFLVLRIRFSWAVWKAKTIIQNYWINKNINKQLQLTKTNTWEVNTRNECNKNFSIWTYYAHNFYSHLIRQFEYKQKTT